MTTHRPGSMVVPKNVHLNFDILTSVPKFCETATDLVALMHTSRGLYAAGIQPLVHLGLPIHTTDVKLASFKMFLDKNVPAARNALRSLSFSVDGNRNSFSSQSASIMFNLLTTERTRLQELAFESDGDWPWVGWTSFTEQFEHLQKTHFRTAQLSSAKPLEGAYYGGLILLLLGNPGPEYIGPELCDKIMSVAQGCFSNLTVLKMASTFAPRFRILEAACPNLQELSWDNTEYDWLSMSINRAENARFWAEKDTLSPLRRLTADVATLFQMALKQDLEILSVTGGLTSDPAETEGHEDCMMWLTRDLSKLSVKSLNLTLDTSGASILSEILKNTRLDKLDQLSVLQTLDRTDALAVAPHEILHNISTAGSKIQELSLNFRQRYQVLDTSSVEEFGVRAWPSRAKAMIPTITKLSIRIARIAGTADEWISVVADYRDGEEVRYTVDSNREILGTTARRALQG